MTNMISRRLRITRAISLATVMLLAGGALAWASIPDSGGTIQGCYASNGTLRVVDTDLGQSCKSNEKALDWSATNRKAYQGQGAGHLSGSNPIVAADVTLPPGPYSLTAAVEIINTGPANVQIACFLNTDSAEGEYFVTLVHQTVGPASANASTFATLSATGVAPLSLGGVAKMECQDQLNSGSPTSLQGTIVATSVDEIEVQP
jgi:hypothetical protein